MDFEYFDRLTEEEARLFLRKFLFEESRTIEYFIADAKNEGLICDYSFSSIPKCGEWAIDKVHTNPIEPDLNLPKWILESETYAKGLFELDENSKILVLRFAFYFGECFRRNYEGMEWSIGDINTAVKNMPVIIGFKKDIELSSILVVENLFNRILAGDGDTSGIKKAVETWQSYSR
jgi:hypothetical protein